MGSGQTPGRSAERRLKFTSVRNRESQRAFEETLDVPELRASLAAIGEGFTAAYVAVARRALLGLEAAQDGRARRRAAKLRSDTSLPKARSNPER